MSCEIKMRKIKTALCATLLLLFTLFSFVGCKPIPSRDTRNTTPVVSCDLRVLFLKVGNADCSMLTIDGRHYLIDTGSKGSFPQLKSSLEVEGVTKLDGVFITHNHNDHIGGLKELLKLLPVDAIYGPYITDNNKKGENALDAIAEDQGMTIKRLKAGESLELSPTGAVLDVVGPVVFNPDSENDNSLVMYLAYQEHIILFAGDMQFSEEQTLLDHNALIQCDVLKVGRHGRSGATSSEFVNQVSPSIAIISTNNTYKNNTANSDAISTLEKSGAKVYLTQDSKAGIFVVCLGGVLEVVTDRIP